MRTTIQAEVIAVELDADYEQAKRPAPLKLGMMFYDSLNGKSYRVTEQLELEETPVKESVVLPAIRNRGGLE